MKLLSVLTCSLKNRSRVFNRLENILKKQIFNTNQVEMLANIDNGEKTIGCKRNELLKAANGQYVVFVDDDDIVSGDYIFKILTALNYNDPDCCGIEGQIIAKNQMPKKFMHSIRYRDWYEKDGIYYRCPNHLNPIRKELALSVGFEDLSTGEDMEFSVKILPLLKTEVFIQGMLYYYYPSIKI
jgi:glycosyltransferase involved in cell wall biosynthesis